MSRSRFRRLVGAAAAVAIGGALVACSSGSSPQSDSSAAPVEVTAFYAEGGGQEVVPQRVIESFIEAHPGSTVDSVIGGASFQEIFLAYQTTQKREVDFGLSFTPIHVEQANSIEMFESLDMSRLPNLAELPENFIAADGTAVAPTTGVMAIVYKEGLEDPPTSWMDLLDPRFKGKVGLFDAPQGIYFNGIAQVNKILGGDPATLDKGMAAFEEAAKNGQFSTIYTSNQTQFSALMNGEVEVGVSASLVVGSWQDDGAPFKFVIPDEGAMLVPVYNAILAGGSPESVEASYWMINEAASPKNLETIAENYSVPNIPDVELPEKTSRLLGISNSSELQGDGIDWAGVTANMSDLTTAWNNRVKVHLGG